MINGLERELIFFSRLIDGWVYLKGGEAGGGGKFLKIIFVFGFINCYRLA